MRTLALAIAMLASVLTPAAALAACQLKVPDVIATSPYFASDMRVMRQSPGSVSLVHKEDPRIAAIFTLGSPESLEGMSRSEYVAGLEMRAKAAPPGAGRQTEHAVFPYDPVGWRTVREQDVPGIGHSIVAHQEIRMSPECLLVADLVTPSSPALIVRFKGLMTAVVGIRETAARYVVPEAWQPDPTAPSGMAALVGGVALPLSVVLMLFVIIRPMLNLDPPGSGPRILQACSGCVALVAAVVMRDAYILGFHDLRYVDGGLLLLLIAAMGAAGASTNQVATLLGLLMSVVGAISIGAATAFRWTPDPYVSGVTAGALLILGGAGFLLWGYTRDTGRKRAVTRRVVVRG